MAYSKSNPPAKLTDGGPGAPAIWRYKSADAHGTVEGANYFSDGGYPLGMNVDDIVFVHRTGTVELTMHVVTAIGAKVGTGGPDRAATISAATLA